MLRPYLTALGIVCAIAGRVAAQGSNISPCVDDPFAGPFPSGSFENDHTFFSGAKWSGRLVFNPGVDITFAGGADLVMGPDSLLIICGQPGLPVNFISTHSPQIAGTRIILQEGARAEIQHFNADLSAEPTGNASLTTLITIGEGATRKQPSRF
ncbi:MAG: hypothetical protein AAGB34_07230 [Planctomycetota bacterium]